MAVKGGGGAPSTLVLNQALQGLVGNLGGFMQRVKKLGYLLYPGLCKFQEERHVNLSKRPLCLGRELHSDHFVDLDRLLIQLHLLSKRHFKDLKVPSPTFQ